jgi:glutamate-1-semialdehyde 2,1-aminomutase
MNKMNDVNRYNNSTKFLLDVEKVIPGGSQTFSKSYTQYPRGVSPLFAARAKGSYIWDIDNNMYIDLVNSLASITLGYNNKVVNRAVKKQLREGVIYSLPGKLEYEVAIKICELVPSAEMVRFAKNGTDATSAAIRLARAYTGRKHIAMCGYHGWQDWSIGVSTRNKGVPKEASDLTHTFQFNDISSLEQLFTKYDGQIAAVIMEPMNMEFPTQEFLVGVRELTKLHNAVLVFDETITGFRFSEGGAQELFGVYPDLTTLGKGIANGYPLAAVTGNREIMKEMEEIFFSGTFGGELLSLAAANKVLELHSDKAVVPILKEKGKNLFNETDKLIRQFGLSEVLSLKGHETWKIFVWQDHPQYSGSLIKTLFLQEMFARGILIIGSHNVSTSLSLKHCSKVLSVYEEVLSLISKGIERENLDSLLKVEPLKPLFKIR